MFFKVFVLIYDSPFIFPPFQIFKNSYTALFTVYDVTNEWVFRLKVIAFDAKSKIVCCTWFSSFHFGSRLFQPPTIYHSRKFILINDLLHWNVCRAKNFYEQKIVSFSIWWKEKDSEGCMKRSENGGEKQEKSFKP